MSARNQNLRSELPKWCGSGLRTADAAGGKVFVYSNPSRQLSVRALYTVGLQHGKSVSFTVASGASVCFKDCDEDSANPLPLDATKLRAQIVSLLPASSIVRVSELPSKVSGPVITNVFELVDGTTLSTELCARILATPRVVDIKVKQTTIYVLQAKPSQVRTSLDFISSRNGFRVRERPAGKVPLRRRRSKQRVFRSTLRRRLAARKGN